MIIIVMGVSGAGKSTIGQMLATKLSWEFFDADDFHPPANVEKMRQGIPLTDADRMPWLLALQEAIASILQQDRNAVLACSALKSSYREIMLKNCDRASVRSTERSRRSPEAYRSQILLVYLKGSFQLIQARLKQRQNHYMSQNLLQSQFDTLEEPEDAISVDISQPMDAIAQQIYQLVIGDW